MPTHDRTGERLAETPPTLWDRLLEHPRVDAAVSRRHQGAGAVWVLPGEADDWAPYSGRLLDVDEAAQLLGLTMAAAA